MRLPRSQVSRQWPVAALEPEDGLHERPSVPPSSPSFPIRERLEVPALQRIPPERLRSVLLCVPLSDPEEDEVRVREGASPFIPSVPIEKADVMAFRYERSRNPCMLCSLNEHHDVHFAC